MGVGADARPEGGLPDCGAGATNRERVVLALPYSPYRTVQTLTRLTEPREPREHLGSPTSRILSLIYGEPAIKARGAALHSMHVCVLCKYICLASANSLASMGPA